MVLFDNVQTPHFNYVGDSILGYKSHMGAGSITSNVKSDKTLVVIKNGAEHIETGRKKVGAILGDYVEVGCNSVLNPGTVIGRHSNIYPVSCVRGVIPADSILKSSGEVVHKNKSKIPSAQADGIFAATRGLTADCGSPRPASRSPAGRTRRWGSGCG